jgi:hypothetical protein
MANEINIYVNKTDLGLDQVDNTSDLDKPISTATQTALNGYETKATAYNSSLLFRFDQKTFHATPTVGTGFDPLTGNVGVNIGLEADMIINMTSVMLHNDSIEPTFTSEFIKSADSLPYITGEDNYIYATLINKSPLRIMYSIKRGGTNLFGTFLTTDLKGANNGVAELDGSGKVPSSQLPSYVDDVEEYANFAGFPVTGASGKIYIALDTNLTYRWGGTTYVEISPSLALGETSASAYRGDRGKIAYDHSQLTSGNPHNVTKTDVGLSNVVNSDTTTTANITDSSNKRFVTDAQLTVIGNTSGTNTGDQDLSGYATKNLTLDRKTASYTLVSSDNNKLIEMNVATANNVTIDNSVFTAGNQILVSQYGAGQVTFVAGSGVTLRSPGGKLKLTGQYSLATIICISASEFYISGDLTA